MGEREQRPHFQRCCGIGRLRTTGGGVRKTFTRCAVNVGRAGRSKRPVAGDTRGQVQIAANGQSEGNLIAPAFASTEYRRGVIQQA
jgi:hypothetical protein